MAVYAWGANSHGQLGLGFESELCMSPQAVTKLSFQPNNIRCIRGGGGHVLVLDIFGRLHACGWNNRGQLGLNSTEECHNEFQSVPSEFFEDVPIESMGCGWDISGCITVGKKLYVWGSNAFHQLGICQRGFHAVRRPLPVRLPRDELPKRISFGLRHCAVLTEDNKVYIFGRLRLNDPPPNELIITHTTMNRADVIKILPTNVNELRIINIKSGQNHLMFKVIDTSTGKPVKRILALGENKFCQTNTFRFDNDVKQIAVGWTHNAVLLKNNNISVWGRNCYGQLGLGKISETQPIPAMLQLPDEIVPAHLHMGSEHTLLRCMNGQVYTWGWNEHGNCGTDSTENILSPKLVELPKTCRLAGAGAGFCYAVCDTIKA